MLDLMAACTGFLTVKALGSYTGASLASVVTGTTARVLLQTDVVWRPSLVALLFSYAAAQMTADPNDIADYLLILLNGCLLFWTALGAHQTLASVAKPPEKPPVDAQGKRPVKWSEPWLRVGA